METAHKIVARHHAKADNIRVTVVEAQCLGMDVSGDVVVVFNPETTRITVYCRKPIWERSFAEAIQYMASETDELGKRWLLIHKHATSKKGMTVEKACDVGSWLYQLAVL